MESLTSKGTSNLNRGNSNFSGTPIFSSSGIFAEILVLQSLRAKAEKKIRQIKRLYTTLSQVNQTIIRAKERDQLFRTICEVAVKFGEFSHAWIGILDERTGDVHPVG